MMLAILQDTREARKKITDAAQMSSTHRKAVVEVQHLPEVACREWNILRRSSVARTTNLGAAWQTALLR